MVRRLYVGFRQSKIFETRKPDSLVHCPFRPDAGTQAPSLEFYNSATIPVDIQALKFRTLCCLEISGTDAASHP
jgi:hypothetical protein